jgi:hypothetical protein
MYYNFRKAFLQRNGKALHLWYPVSTIDTFINEIAHNYILGDKKKDDNLRLTIRNFIKQEAEELFEILVHLSSKGYGKSIFKEIQGAMCIDLKPMLDDDEKYEKLRRLLKIYIRTGTAPGFLYYGIKWCIMDNEPHIYNRFATMADKYRNSDYGNRSDNLRDLLQASQYTKCKLYPFLPLFVDIDDTMLNDKQIVIITAKMRNVLYKYNNYPLTSLFKVDDVKTSRERFDQNSKWDNLFERTTRTEFHLSGIYDID